MQPFDPTKIRFLLGPDRLQVSGAAEEPAKIPMPPGVHPQATNAEFAQASMSAIPFACEVNGDTIAGTCILTDDGRIVMVSNCGARSVLRLTTDGAAKLRASMKPASVGAEVVLS